MTQLAERLGYRLVGANRFGFNAFYLRHDLGQETVPTLVVDALFRHTWAQAVGATAARRTSQRLEMQQGWSPMNRCICPRQSARAHATFAASSPLVLLLPLGPSPAILTIGCDCPRHLSRGRTSQPGTGALVVIAPSARELAKRGWLADAIRWRQHAWTSRDCSTCLRRRAPAGARAACYARKVSPLRPAWRICPTAPRAVCSCPSQAPACAATHRLLPLRRRSQRLLRLLATCPGGMRLLALTPPAGVLARRPQQPVALPHRLAAHVPGLAPAEMILETRPHLNRAILHLFSRAAQAVAVAKVGLAATDDSLGRKQTRSAS